MRNGVRAGMRRVNVTIDKLRRLLALLLVPMPAFAAADAPNETGLMAIYSKAQAHDPVWRGAKAAAAAQRERVPQARAQLLPSLTGSANTADNDISTRVDDPASVIRNSDRRYNSHGYGVTLTQPLFRPQNINAYRAARRDADIADIDLAAAAQDLRLRVTAAYFDVLLAEDTLALVDAQREATRQQWQQAQRNFSLGTVTITDTHEAQARLDLIESQRIAAANDLEIKREALAQLTGGGINELRPLASEFAPRPPAPQDIGVWRQRAQDGNLALRAQTKRREQARIEVGRQRAGHLPTIDAVGSYSDSRAGASSFSNSGTETEAKTASLQLQWSLFSSGGQQSRVREAQANRTRADELWEQTRRQTDLATRSAYLGVTGGLAQVRALEQALVSSESALKSNRVGFDVGVRTGLDVLDAQQQFYNAKRALAEARYQYLLNELRLYAAAGLLDDAALVRIDGLLESRPRNGGRETGNSDGDNRSLSGP